MSSKSIFERIPLYPDGKPRSRDQSWKQVLRRNPKVFLVMARSKNDNLVIMEGFPPNVKQYWLIQDAGVCAGRRKQGIRHDYEAMSAIDARGYGYEIKRNGSSEWYLIIKKLPNHPLLLRNNKSTAYYKYQGQWCEVQHVFIHHGSMVESLMRGVHGIDLYLKMPNGTLVTHHIKGDQR